MTANDPGSTRLPPRLEEAAHALQEDRIDAAEQLLKLQITEFPFDVRAMRMLADVAWRIGRADDAENLLRHALRITPGFAAARSQLATLLGRMGRPAEALPLLDQLFELDSEDIDHSRLKASTLARLGDFETAIALYEEVLARSPERAAVWISYGHILKTVGRLQEGIAAYRKAIDINPRLGAAWFNLANLKTFQFDEADRKAMRAALETPGLGDEDRFHLEFALGKAEHDAGETAQAFAHYAEGNALRRKHHPYDSRRIHQAVERSIEAFTAEFFASGAGGHEARDPIFVVGMPRAGSTLVEQILSSHSQVEGTSELADLPALAKRGTSYTDMLLNLTDEERTALGRQYVERTAVQRRTAKPYFVDKAPNNWLFVPFIHRILPNAKIIDARRHPLGCCFSNFRQHFARGQDFAYDLTDLGNYYSDYVRMMAHIDRLLPGRVHRVIYEKMVSDTEAEVRALLEHIGLEFEPACLSFYETKRAVRTPSSEQVRQPIYRGATDEWRPYEPFLGPLKEALGEVLDSYPEAPASFLQGIAAGR